MTPLNILLAAITLYTTYLLYKPSPPASLPREPPAVVFRTFLLRCGGLRTSKKLRADGIERALRFVEGFLAAGWLRKDDQSC